MLAVVMLATACDAAGQAARTLPVFLSSQGLPGLIVVPGATTLPGGTAAFVFNGVANNGLDLAGAASIRQRNVSLALGFLPRLTVSGRGTIATRASDGVDVRRDLSASMQLLLLPEGRVYPAVALGMQDVGGAAAHLEARYLVASKSVLGHLRLTAGYGLGPDLLDGGFGGAEVMLRAGIYVVGEYDARDVNVGLRLSPFRAGLASHGMPRPTLDLVWRHGGLTWNAGLSTALGRSSRHIRRAFSGEARYHRPDEPTVDLARLQQALVERGLENVMLSLRERKDATGEELVVSYENRRFLHTQTDGLGLVLGVVIQGSPSSVTRLRIVVNHEGIPILELGAESADVLAFLNDDLSPAAFRGRVVVEPGGSRLRYVQGSTSVPLRNDSRYRLDLVIRPRFANTLLTEFGRFDVWAGLALDASTRVAPGTVIDARLNVPLGQTSEVFGGLGGPSMERMLLHQTMRLPLGGWSSALSAFGRLSAGRFGTRTIRYFTLSHPAVGVVGETAMAVADGRITLGGTAGRLGATFGHLRFWTATATTMVRYEPWNATLATTAGRFIDQDRGVSIALRRFFGNTEIGFFLRHSTRGTLGGVTAVFPLAPRRSMRPARLRLRLPERYGVTQHSILFQERNELRSDVARALLTDERLEDVLWDRNRLHPAYLRAHLDRLRDAAQRLAPPEQTAVTPAENAARR